MNTKQQIAQMLEESGEGYVSGNSIADRLDLTRAAVWKCIRQLECEGYQIDSSRHGYRLGPQSDALSEYYIDKYLDTLSDRITLEVYQDIDSTNNYLKETAARGQHDNTHNDSKKNVTGSWHVVVASAQSAGRGRRGRTFISSAGTGVYMSVLLRPQISPDKITRITTAAAVAACRAIESCTEEKAQIKWVNDVYVRGKKTCGILTEASMDLESGVPDWVVMGIGFNVYEPENGFPEEIKEIAGAISTEKIRDLRSRIAASFLKEFYSIVSNLEDAAYADEYKSRSFLIGQDINVIGSNSTRPAKAVDIDEECRLIVEYEDGTKEALFSGEVSVRVKKS